MTEAERGEYLKGLLDASEGYARQIARAVRAQAPHVAFEDILAGVRYGFARAALKFDPARGFTFLTYAVPWGRKGAYIAVRFHSTGFPYKHLMGNHSTRRVRCGGWRELNPDLDAGPPHEFPDDTEEVFWARALKPLAARERELVEAVYRGGETVADVARRWGVSRERGKQIHHRALERLRDHGVGPALARMVRDRGCSD